MGVLGPKKVSGDLNSNIVTEAILKSDDTPLRLRTASANGIIRTSNSSNADIQEVI